MAAILILAALAEIGGCFAFWAWMRMGRSALWLVPGIVLLIAFAWLLTRIDAGLAGRVYAAYGGVYVAASVAWLRIVEGQVPTASDLAGALLCLAGTTVILTGALAR